MASGSTTRLGIPYPVSSDVANISSDMAAIAEFIDPIVSVFYQGSAFSGTPIVGNFWWCTDATSSSYGLNWYNGTTWLQVSKQNIYVGTTAPSVPFPGLVWYNPSAPSIQYYTSGSAWATLAIPVGQLYTTTSNNGYALKTSGGAASFSAPSAGASNTNSSTTVSSSFGNANFGTVSVSGYTKYLVVCNTVQSGYCAGGTNQIVQMRVVATPGTGSAITVSNVGVGYFNNSSQGTFNPVGTSFVISGCDPTQTYSVQPQIECTGSPTISYSSFSVIGIL